MELTKELQMSIVNDFGTIKSVDISYANGELVSGFLTNVNYVPPLDATICKHRVLRGDNPYHFIDFDSAVKIELKYQDGTTKTFE